MIFFGCLAVVLAGRANNVVISNVPGPRETLFLDGARLDEVYPVSIPTHTLALNITISGYGDRLGFGYTACRRSVPALQRMLDYTDESINELEQALAARPEAAVTTGTIRKKPVSRAGAKAVSKAPAAPAARAARAARAAKGTTPVRSPRRKATP